VIEIKICGITDEREIEYLNILKPEYIGFVFTKSKRKITAEKAKQLCANLDKDIKTVGVFKDNSLMEILDVIKEIPLKVLQLHGQEDVNYIASIKKNTGVGIKIWKAVSINDTENIKKYVRDNNEHLIERLLIDGDTPGSGEAFPLKNIRELFKEDSNIKYRNETINDQYNFFLAGGITPENVSQRIIEARPGGIDVSSGVEIIDEGSNRRKSFKKMESLIKKVRAINNV
jgi:phosphoribosylanthranilate isomerase